MSSVPKILSALAFRPYRRQMKLIVTEVVDDDGREYEVEVDPITFEAYLQPRGTGSSSLNPEGGRDRHEALMVWGDYPSVDATSIFEDEVGRRYSTIDYDVWAKYQRAELREI